MPRAYFSLTNNIDQPTFSNFNLNPSSLRLPLPTTTFLIRSVYCVLPLHFRLTRYWQLSARLSYIETTPPLSSSRWVVFTVLLPRTTATTPDTHTFIFSLPFCHFPPIPTLQKFSCLLCLSLYPSIPSVRHHPRQATAACVVCLLRSRLSRRRPVSLDSLYASISPR